MKQNQDIYIGEYSSQQKIYNITTLKEAVKINRENASLGIFNGYIPVCYGNSFEEVREKLSKIEKELGRP